MIVRLTTKQKQAIVSYLPEAMEEYVLTQDEWLGTHEEGSMTEWAMVPDAFLFIVNALVPESLHLNQNAQRGLRRIVREVNDYRTHPAWTGVAMVGRHDEFLIGWRAGEDGPVHPFFTECRRLKQPQPVLLHPRIHEDTRPVVTDWWANANIDATDLVDEVHEFARRVLPHQHPSFQEST